MTMSKSANPAHDEMEYRRIREAVELCGKNRGPHEYMPIEWRYDGNSTTELVSKRVTRLMCRVCFVNVDISTLIKSYKGVSF